jgi:hypothetical protein
MSIGADGGAGFHVAVKNDCLNLASAAAASLSGTVPMSMTVADEFPHATTHFRYR